MEYNNEWVSQVSDEKKKSLKNHSISSSKLASHKKYQGQQGFGSQEILSEF